MIEKEDEELTTVQITKRSSRLLAQLARAYKRSKSGQVVYMVDIEVEKLLSVMLFPPSDAPDFVVTAEQAA